MIKEIKQEKHGYQCLFAAYVADKSLASVAKAYDEGCGSPKYGDTFNHSFLDDCEGEEAQEVFKSLQREGWIDFVEDEDCIVVKIMADTFGEKWEDIVL